MRRGEGERERERGKRREEGDFVQQVHVWIDMFLCCTLDCCRISC